MHPTLLAVPNVSEGRDGATIAAIGEAFVGAGATLLDVHADPDHNRSVYTLAGTPDGLAAPGGPVAVGEPAARGGLAQALLAGMQLAIERVSIADGRGQHPHVGAVDVAPIVYLRDADRGAACAVALLLGDLLAERLGLPVLFYGELAAGRTRAQLRRGGAAMLARRVAEGELRPDFGPARLHPTAGATLIAARPPLVAFNLELAPPAGIADAKAIAAEVREGGEHGLLGLRAIGVTLHREIAQVSMNVEDPLSLPLRTVLAAVAERAEALGARVVAAELVGLAPEAALHGFPRDMPLRGFDPKRHVIENALRAVGVSQQESSESKATPKGARH